jgi:Fic family protein
MGVYGCTYGKAMFTLDTLKITPEVLNLIAGIDEFKGAWRSLGTLAPERLRALRHVATIESIGSSTRIEGSKLSDREVERLLSKLDLGSFASRDEQEVAGYAEVMETAFRAWEDLPFTENYIKQFHRDLLRHSGKIRDIVASTKSYRTVLQPSMGREGRLGLFLRPPRRLIRHG